MYILPVIAVVVGIAVLLWSAGRFVDGAVVVARRLGMSQLLVGMIIVGFGTSLPEMLVSAISAFQGAPGIALGNAYGSNIANITLILGITALVNPIPVNSRIVLREMYTLILVSAVVFILLAAGRSITRLDGIFHIALFFAVMFVTARRNRADAGDPLPGELAAEGADAVDPGMSMRAAVVWVAVGLALLLASSRALVWGAVELARMLGVDELTIGLTIVAVGTSLPELASSLAAARKNHHDVAVGNVIGSNLFNTLVVVGIAGVIHPLGVDPLIVSRDFVAMAVVTLLLLSMCVGWNGRPAAIGRTRGGLLLILFAAYNLWVAWTSVGAPAGGA